MGAIVTGSTVKFRACRSVFMCACTCAPLCGGLDHIEARAANVNWLNPAGGVFSAGNNWLGGVPPTAVDRAVFNLGNATYDVTLDADVVNESLSVDDDAVDLDLGGFTYALPFSASSTGFMRVAPSAASSGALHLSNGTLAMRSGRVGSFLGVTPVGTGQMTVGAGATCTAGNLFHVGQFGHGSLTVTSGGRFVMTNEAQQQPSLVMLYVGIQDDARGALTVTGADAVVDVAASIGVGLSGSTGTMTIENGGRVSCHMSAVGLTSANVPATVGHVHVRGAGSSWTARGNHYFGSVDGVGSAYVTVTDGGLLQSTGTVQPDVIESAAGEARVRVTGAGSRYLVADGLIVGFSAHGELHVEGGGEFVGPNLELALNGGSSGSVTVGGAGARIYVSNLLRIGGEFPFIGGSASVTVNTGGAVSVGGTTLVSPQGAVHYNGGSFSAGALEVRGRVLLGHGQKLLRARSVLVSGAGSIDLRDNAMLIDYDGPSPILAVRDMIRAAHAGGSWTGEGIGTSVGDATRFALGYADAADLPSVPPIFGNVDATSVLVRYARYGDANLDGAVNLQDFNRLATNFGATGAIWDDGDFNYDGNVNLADFNLLASNFGLSAAGPHVTPQDWAALGAAVPEPMALGAAGIFCLLARRSRLSRLR